MEFDNLVTCAQQSPIESWKFYTFHRFTWFACDFPGVPKAQKSQLNKANRHHFTVNPIVIHIQRIKETEIDRDKEGERRTCTKWP